jgi:OOP family OmpA-OmpF porin
MKTTVIVCIAGMLMLSNTSEAQILKKLEQKVERKVNQRIDRKTDRAIDKGLDKIEETSKGKPTSEAKQSAPAQSQGNYATSKYDFVSGDKVVFYDNFDAEPTGDFPSRWNTSGSGEVVALKNQTGKWLKLPDNTISFPEINATLPTNFTIEFNLLYPESGLRPPVTFGFSEVKNPAKTSLQHKSIFYFMVPPSVKQYVGYSTSLYSGKETTQEWAVDKMTNKNIRVSIAVNGTRIRLYLDAQKIFDLPKGFDKNSYRNNFHFRAAPLLPNPKDAFYISDIKIAETGKDARSSLLNEGKFSTSGIYFETGSAKLQQQSHGVLKEIADALLENKTMNVEIIGHTDTTGSPSSNQILSEQRAAAVKEYLMKNFTIDKNRCTTSGKGASEPIAPNSTAEGKAQNRRVEFIRK